MADNPKATAVTTARVVQLRYCTTHGCTYAEGEHLEAHSRYVAVRRGEAIAISYAWGALDRSRQVLGHYEDGKPVEMELGEEWNLADLKRTLVGLCDEADNFGQARHLWMDQLCLNQGDDQAVRATLARIPDLYRSFEVVMLMPGALCQCHVRMMDHIRHFESEAHQYDDIVDKKAVKDPRTTCQHPEAWYERLSLYHAGFSRCMNNISFNQLFGRLWPRQELLYSSRVRMRWVGKEVINCHILPFLMERSDVDEKELYELLALEQLNLDELHTVAKAAVKDDSPVSRKSQPSDDPKVGEHLRVQAVRANGIVIGSIREWATYNFIFGADGTSDSSVIDVPFTKIMSLTRRLLYGDVLDADETRGRPKPNTDNDPDHFLKVLYRLGSDSLMATKPKDYVLAVWIDCPGYVVPEGFRDMSFGDLIQHAVDHLYSKFGRILYTTLPAGLLGAKDTTQYWRPSLYVRPGLIHDSSMLYGTIVDSDSILRLEDLPTPKADTGGAGLRPLIECRVQPPYISKLDVFRLFSGAVASWKRDPHNAVVETLFRKADMASQDMEVEEDPKKEELMLAFRDLIALSSSSRPSPFSLGLPRQAHLKQSAEEIYLATYRKSVEICCNKVLLADDDTLHDVIYTIVCIALHVPEAIARDHGLKVVVDPGRGEIPSRLGLMRQGPERKDRAGTWYLSVRHWRTRANGVMYEVIRKIGAMPSSDLLDWEVMGVWVACDKFPGNALVGGYFTFPSESGELVYEKW